MKNNIYQIQISLKGFKPKIWRRILIQSNLLLSDFHKVIQTTMGWKNSHLHQFVKNGTFYTKRYPEDNYWDEMDNVDYINMPISDLLKMEKEKITYEYDFGDSWTHEIVLEKINPDNNVTEYPLCLSGEKNCPPEDCGGVWGYSDMLDILKQPDHEEYESYIEWLGVEFDPEYFDLDEINKTLKQPDFGCFEIND
ncbi:MAG: plasmid pRiA4b ORF-3 family protein [Bacteroidales bacterium]|nr:plasmid pRiA4b ORF-3 family protein [Bacteroidales bacterium]